MYNCALSQSSHVDCQTLICVNPWPDVDSFRLIELVSMHLIMRLEPINLDSYYPLPDSMYNCALSQSSHVDCQTLICVNPCQTLIRLG